MKPAVKPLEGGKAGTKVMCRLFLCLTRLACVGAAVAILALLGPSMAQACQPGPSTDRAAAIVQSGPKPATIVVAASAIAQLTADDTSGTTHPLDHWWGQVCVGTCCYACSAVLLPASPALIASDNGRSVIPHSQARVPGTAFISPFRPPRLSA